MATRASHKAPLRRRPFTLKAVEVTPSNRRGRHTILTPMKGYRIGVTQLGVRNCIPRHLRRV